MGGRHIMIDWVCKNCGKTFQIKRSKVKEGKNYFCTKPCFNEWEKEEGKKTWGKDKAKVYLDKSRNTYYARWIDLDGIQKSTTWAHWAWEMEHGEVPNGYRVTFIDGNQLNNSLDNLCLKSWDEYGDEASKRLSGRKLSDETKHKLSVVHTGKTLTQEHKDKIAKNTKEMWADPTSVFNTPEYRAKLSVAYNSREVKPKRQRVAVQHVKHSKEDVNKIRSQKSKEYWSKTENRLSVSNKLKGRKFSSEHIENLKRTATRGESSNLWRGGTSYQTDKYPYPEEFSPENKRKIRVRDNHTCQVCDSHVKGFDGCIHHIDGNKQNCVPDNLVLVCRSCHNKIHGGLSSDIRVVEYQQKLNYYGIIQEKSSKHS